MFNCSRTKFEATILIVLLFLMQSLRNPLDFSKSLPKLLYFFSLIFISHYSAI